MTLEVVLLGTGNPLPHPDRAGPATLVRTESKRVLVDCGRGVLMRLASVGVLPIMLDAVFLTHLHSDHICDFSDVLTTHWVMSPISTPLHVVGPPGTAEFVDATLAMLQRDIGWRIAHHDDLHEQPRCEVAELSEVLLLDHPLVADGTLRVRIAPTEHKPVHPTIGFRFEADNKSVAIVGDTVPCDGVDRLCDQASIYVQTVVREAAVRNIPSKRMQDILDYHSTSVQAGVTAARNGVRTLVMTHMVPAPPDDAAEADWIADAAQAFAGNIVVGRDLQTIVAG